MIWVRNLFSNRHIFKFSNRQSFAPHLQIFKSTNFQIIRASLPIFKFSNRQIFKLSELRSPSSNFQIDKFSNYQSFAPHLQIFKSTNFQIITLSNSTQSSSSQYLLPALLPSLADLVLLLLRGH